MHVGYANAVEVCSLGEGGRRPLGWGIFFSVDYQISRAYGVVVVHDQFVVIERPRGVWLAQDLSNQKRVRPVTLSDDYKDAPNDTP